MTRVLLLLSVLSLGLAACSTTDSRSDDERIIGLRNATAINARVLGASVPVRDIGETTPESQVLFTSAATGRTTSIRLVLPDSLTVGAAGVDVTVPLPDQISISGTYRLDTEAEQVVITRNDTGQAVTLAYAFRGSDGLELIAEDEEAIMALLGLAGPDATRLARVVQGVSVRFGSPLFP